MSAYCTKQRKILLSYLSEHRDEQFSARQIADDLSVDGISLSAVYRNLAALENENKITRTKGDGRRDTFYRYSAAEECKECLHLCCKKCGKTFHMETNDADSLVSSVEKSSDFQVDKSESVLYGICRNCKKI